ncbi:MAG TPA: RluA family pseudouridine synthase [Nitrolancea sp.]|nr:RluA family pseudouridine synthase [Nitrolancea sp.]
MREIVELSKPESIDAIRLVFDVAASEDSERLDRLIAARAADISRSFAQELIKGGDVKVNDEVARPSRRVRSGDIVELALPPVKQPSHLSQAFLPVPIVYENDDILIFDKPPGIVTHPAPGHEHGTLVNVVRALRPDLELRDNERPGIVHRLDKDTSGLIVVAKNEVTRRYLLQQWQDRSVVKRYTALVHGVIAESEGTIDAPISRDPNNRKRMWVVPGGRPAITNFQVMERFDDATLLSVIIETGRTHQIRVHFTYIGYPLVGDRTYGTRPFRFDLERQFLHASALTFHLPGERLIEVETPLPVDLQSVLDILRASSKPA